MADLRDSNPYRNSLSVVELTESRRADSQFRCYVFRTFESSVALGYTCIHCSLVNTLALAMKKCVIFASSSFKVN